MNAKSAEQRKVYSRALREAASLIERGKFAKVNIAALVEAAEYARQRQLGTLCRQLRRDCRGSVGGI